MQDAHDAKDINRIKFLTRLSSEIGKRGVVDVLRKGIEHHPVGHFDLFYGTPPECSCRPKTERTPPSGHRAVPRPPFPD